jgi:hypothetical protein
MKPCCGTACRLALRILAGANCSSRFSGVSAKKSLTERPASGLICGPGRAIGREEARQGELCSQRQVWVSLPLLSFLFFFFSLLCAIYPGYCWPRPEAKFRTTKAQKQPPAFCILLTSRSTPAAPISDCRLLRLLVQLCNPISPLIRRIRRIVRLSRSHPRWDTLTILRIATRAIGGSACWPSSNLCLYVVVCTSLPLAESYRSFLDFLLANSLQPLQVLLLILVGLNVRIWPSFHPSVLLLPWPQLTGLTRNCSACVAHRCSSSRVSPRATSRWCPSSR